MPRIESGVAIALVLFVALGGPNPLAAQSLVVSSNPELAALAESLLPELAERSGLELTAPVRLEERSREELVRYLESKLDEELPVEEAEQRTYAYALLGMVPADLDLRAVVKDLYTEQVAGFYEPDSTALFILDDQADEDLEALLVHELVHAIQDQTTALDELTDPDLGNDRASAAQAAIEGHATLVMMEVVISGQAGMPVDLSQLPQFGALVQGSLGSMLDEYPSLASAPRVLQESLVFPYVGGALYLHNEWLGGGRIAPFGDDLPLSTEQIINGSGVAPPLDVDLTVSDATVLFDDVMGRLELGIFLTEQLGEAAEELADGWDGDRVALAERDGARALALVTIWDSVESRDAFVAALSGRATGAAGPISVEPIEVDGRAATLLTAGEATLAGVRAALRAP